MAMEIELVDLTEDLLPEAVAVMVAAYQANESFHRAFGRWFPIRREWFVAHFTYACRLAMLVKPAPLVARYEGNTVGVVNYANTDPQAEVLLADWQPVAAYLDEMKRHSTWMTRFLTHRYSRAVWRQLPRSYFFSIEQIGVAPWAQGKGVARELIKEICRRSMLDSRSTGVAITTYNPDNASYYQRLGFQVVGQRKVWGTPAVSLFRSQHCTSG